MRNFATAVTRLIRQGGNGASVTLTRTAFAAPDPATPWQPGQTPGQQGPAAGAKPATGKQ